MLLLLDAGSAFNSITLYAGIFPPKLHNNKPTEIAEQILVQLYSINFAMYCTVCSAFLSIYREFIIEQDKSGRCCILHEPFGLILSSNLCGVNYPQEIYEICDGG